MSFLVVLRNYGKVIYDILNKYGGVLPITKLRKLEKATKATAQRQQRRQSQLRYKFLVKLQKIRRNIKVSINQFTIYQQQRCKTFHKRLPRSALRKRNHEKLKLDKELNNLKSEIRNTINGIDWYLLIQAI